MKTKIQSALEIPQDELHGAEVRLPWVMHVKTNLLNGIGNIRTGESEILEGPSYAAIMDRVRYGGPISGELGVSIHRGAARLALTHTSTVKNIQHILSLGEEQTVISAVNSDTQK